VAGFDVSRVDFLRNLARQFNIFHYNMHIYRMSAMKRHGFRDALKLADFLGVKCTLRTTGVQVPSKILGYLTGHCWGAQTVLT
jgi:hypothetical protein